MTATRFLDPDWWRNGAGRKEDAETFRELTFRLGFVMQVRPTRCKRGPGRFPLCFEGLQVPPRVYRTRRCRFGMVIGGAFQLQLAL